MLRDHNDGTDSNSICKAARCCPGDCMLTKAGYLQSCCATAEGFADTRSANANLMARAPPRLRRVAHVCVVRLASPPAESHLEWEEAAHDACTPLGGSRAKPASRRTWCSQRLW